MAAVTLRNVSKSFSEKAAVKSIDLDVDGGEILAVVGPSGSGKTTLLRLMSLLIYPSAGSIFIQGVDAGGDDRHRRTLRRCMGVVFQHPALFDTTVFNNVALGLKIRGYHKGEIRDMVYRMLDLMELSGLDHRRVNTLSGGEAQRVALARALVTEPEILLLDEPTANLDPKNVEIIEDIVSQTNAESKTTVILATHNLNQARRLAHRVAILLGGELVEVGEAAQIFEGPKDERTEAFIGGKMVW